MEAARQVGGELYAAQVALCLLVRDGVVEVSDEGILTAVPDAPEPTDPLLGALALGIRHQSPPGTRLYEVLDEPHFEPYRARLTQQAPGLRRYAERTRFLALLAAYSMSFGLSMHSLAAGAPVPFFSSDSPDWWLPMLLPVWALLSLSAAAWPGEFTRRWRGFTEECRQRADAALATLPPDTLSAVDENRYRPTPSTPRGRASARAEGDGPGDGGSWADDVSAASCGSGCGGGD